MTPAVAEAYDAFPAHARARLQEIRKIIFDVAETTETGPLTETLKWGQPSYLTEATNSGTTLRLAHSDKHADHVGLYVHCQTNLIDRYRGRFAQEFTYDGNRAVLIPLKGELPTEALHQVIAMALTYHRDKRG